MAVIVQAMVPSEVSGVAFSVHPVTQDTSQMVIEAGLGLGEAVVSGAITPDLYVVGKHTAAVIDRHVGRQQRMLVRGDDGEQRWTDAGAAGSAAKLNAAQLLELGSAVLDLERHFGKSVDVEWGYAGGKLSILQCRPITTLQP